MRMAQMIFGLHGMNRSYRFSGGRLTAGEVRKAKGIHLCVKLTQLKGSCLLEGASGGGLCDLGYLTLRSRTFVAMRILIT